MTRPRRRRDDSEAQPDAPLNAAARGKIQDDIMRVLSAEPPAA